MRLKEGATYKSTVNGLMYKVVDALGLVYDGNEVTPIYAFEVAGIQGVTHKVYWTREFAESGNDLVLVEVANA